MHLYLSKHSPLDSSFATEDGQVMFKVDTEPVKVGTRKSNISCLIPGDIPRRKNGEEDAYPDMQDRFGSLAQIEFNTIASSIIHFQGNQVDTKDYFRKDGWGAYGRHRVFTAPDGREYKWLLRMWSSKLIVNDEKQTPVAEFHRGSLGIIGKARPASLEIFEAGEHMTETILVTFIYIEKIRKDKERAAR